MTTSQLARKTRRSWGTFAGLALLAVLFMVPFYWIVVASLQPTSSIFSTPPNLFPQPFTLENYQRLVLDTNFPIWFWNSSIIAILHVATVVPISALAAFGFAKYEFRGRHALFIYVLAFMMVPIQVLAVPLYIGFLSTGFANSYLPLVLPWAVTPFAIFLIRQWMVKIPTELIDAARIDGASEFRIFWSVAMPLSLPALGSVAVIEFLASWNNFFFPALVLTSNASFTLPVGIGSFVTDGSAGERLYGPLAAASVLTIIPVIVIFMFLQRYFVKGMISSGASK